MFNRVIGYLTFSDVFSWGLYYSVSVLAGVYVSIKLGANAVEYIGIGTSIYMLTRAIFQIPIGTMLDNWRKDQDEITLLLLSDILMATPYLLYPFITTPVVYYVLQFIFGLGAAMNLVSWRKLFAGNLDKNHEGRQYASYETLLSLFTAGFSFCVGLIANISQHYFDVMIFGVGVMMMSSIIWPLMIQRTADRRTNKA